MRKIWWVAVLLVTSAFLLAAGDGDRRFAQWDANNDGAISLDEFAECGTCGWFDGWDVNRDGRLERNEFQERQGFDFRAWDLNGNGELNQTEYRRGLFERFDADGDGQLDRQEWDQADEKGWFNAPRPLPEQARQP